MGWVIGVSSIALVLLVLLIIFGNLSGNLGFATGTQGYNDTQNVIGNVSSGVSKLTAQIPTVLLFVGIALLLFVLIGVLAYVIKKMSGFGGGKGGTD
jgi:asparagine N-glycosylation enzyme membrane subunit Stt3